MLQNYHHDARGHAMSMLATFEGARNRVPSGPGATAPRPRLASISPGARLQRSNDVRRCPCGGIVGPEGECAACRAKRLGLQRRAVRPGRGIAPPIVHDVLSSSGRSLDSRVRTLMESRFGHDFTQVRVHTDAQASISAQAVNAQAYTVGRDIVFAAGRYTPDTDSGKRLLAHELAHVVQQASATDMRQPLEIGDPQHAFEREAEAIGGDLFGSNQSTPKGAIQAAVSRLPVRPYSAPLVQRSCATNANETFYSTAPNYCRDTGFTGALHPGQRCYREVPPRTWYFQCPPGDQVCFDASGGCHDSFDLVSPVESKDADGSCNLHGLCSIGHGFADVVPGLLEEMGRAQMECLRMCETQPWYLKGFCIQGCTGGGPM